MSEEKRTEISTLGEFGLINNISKKANLSGKYTIKGIGDDAAVIDHGDHVELISTDLLIEGVHFDLMYTPLKHLGYKAVAVNVSDIAAMNGTATHITVSIALSNRFSVEAVEEFYEGVNLACEQYNIDLVGGDTTSSLSGFMISVTACGRAAKEDVVYRNGAKVGDIICVTGGIGAAYFGLQYLEREKQVFLEDKEMQPKLDDQAYVIERFLKPEARLDIIHELKEMKILPTSMIDISDGLASELYHICSQSKVGAEIFDTELPISQLTKSAAFEFNLDPTMAAMNGGEDYELLFTINKEDVDKIKNVYDVVMIGEIKPIEDDLNLITKSGKKYKMKAQGWNHFQE